MADTTEGVAAPERSPNQASVTEFAIQERDRSHSDPAVPHDEVPSTSAAPKRRLTKSGNFHRFKRFLHNKEQRTYCNRTCKSWLTVSGYYLMFITIVFLIFMALLYGCVNFVKYSQNTPWISKKNLIEDNIPGISYIPNIDYLSESVIWYNLDTTGPTERAKKYIDEIQEYFKHLEETCHINSRLPCNFNRSALGPCAKKNFGYDSKHPCIIIRLNKLEDWIPKGFADNAMPDDIPNHLKEDIIHTEEVRLWLDCKGLDPYDQDHLNQLEYYPIPGYPASAFPYTDNNRQHYVSPIVALHLNNVDTGRVLCLKCNLYSANYYQEKHFEQLTKTYVYIQEVNN